MLTFLAPWALLGAALLAIPVIVHLFQPKRVRQTPFSSLRWLHLTQQRLARRIKWHQILLFLLRAAFIVLLVLALAKPVLQQPGAAGVVERLIVIDVSRSMGYRVQAGSSPLDAAKQSAAALIAQTSAEDRTAVLLTGTTTQMLTPLVQDKETALPALRALQAGATDTDLSSALPQIRALLPQCRTGAQVELYFITDQHARSWTPARISEFARDLPEKTSVRIVDVGVKGPQNAWIADARVLDAEPDLPTAATQEQTVRVQVRCIGDAGQKRALTMTGVPGLPDSSQPLTLDPGEPLQVDFRIPASARTADSAARFRLEPADALPDDDDYLVNLSTAGVVRILLLESDTAPVASLRPGFHLRTAIESLSQAAGGTCRLTTRTPTAAVPRDLTDVDVIFMADVSDLSGAMLKAVEERVRAGAGLAIFLGPAAQSRFYNTQMYDPLRPRDGLLPLPLRGITQASAESGGMTPLENLDGSHPLLAGLQDPLLGDLGRTQIREFYRFDGQLHPQDAVLAWIEGKVPAIIEHPLGAGKVFVLNLTANDAWSDLPRRKGYLPLVDRLLAQLSGGGLRHAFTAGEGVAVAVRDLQPHETVVIETPDGKEITPTLTASGRLALARFDAPSPGLYRLVRRGSTSTGFPIVVQASRADSDLTPQDSAMLTKWWAPADVAVVEAKSIVPDAGTRAGRRALWPRLMLIAGLCLVAEMFFVHWLCPRVNPPMARSIVGHRAAPS